MPFPHCFYINHMLYWLVIKYVIKTLQMENMEFFLVEVCLLHYKMIKYSPSMLVVVDVYIAQCTLRKDPCWSKTLTLHTSYSEADLKQGIMLVVSYLLNMSHSWDILGFFINYRHAMCILYHYNAQNIGYISDSQTLCIGQL